MSDRASQFLHAAESSVSAGSASPRDSPLGSRSLKRVAGLESDLPSKRPKLNDSIRELVISYTKNEATDSKLYRQLVDLGVSNPDLNSIALVAQRVSIHVGECAGDLVWRRQLKEQPANKENTRIHEVVKHWPFAMPNLDSGSRGLNVSHKFLRLVQVIESFESYGESFRGVVFVQHHATARAIAELVPMLSGRLSFVRASTFAWEGSMQRDDAEQILQKFSSGIFNLLVARKSVEDLDIPKSKVVIQFDLSEGLLSYAHIRRLVASSDGFLVHMIERCNPGHTRILQDLSTQHPDLRRWIQVVDSLSSAIPPMSLSRVVLDEDEGADNESNYGLLEPISGARITPAAAVEFVYRAASLADDVHFPAPLFDFDIETAGDSALYTCTVLLPSNGVASVVGQQCSSAGHARRSACHTYCTRLWEAGLLDATAFVARQPTPPKPSTSSDQAGVQVYPANTPDFWKRIPAGSRLFPVLITVAGLAKEYSPIILLTRDLMPSLLPFKLFPPGQVAKIQLLRCSPFVIDSERLTLLHSYTLRLCRAVTNRPLTCAVEGAPYFVAPLPRHWSGDTDRLVDTISWDLVTQAADSWCIPLKYGNAEDVAADIEDAVIVDRTAEFTRRYESLRVRQDLSPLSHPEDSPREAAYANLLEYCKAVRKNFEGLDDEGQALIEIESVFATVSHLDPAAPQVATGPQPPRYLIPELCFKFTVPARTFRTALLLPSIMHRVDSFLLVKEVNARFFRNQISESRLDEAITAPSSRMELNYERLELLGDSFLKYLASVYVFVYQPSTGEGALHVARQEIVNNQSLFRAVVSVGLPAYIQSRPFSFKAWQPRNYRMVETGSANGNSEVNAKHARERQHKLGDKVVADTAEAILGAAYLTGGRDTALAAAKALNLPFPLIDRWSDLRRNLLVPPAKITAQLKPGAVEAVEKMVGRKITHRHLVAQALTHISMSPYERVSYERLEFIGDAILELLVVRNIFEQDAKLSPGDLTMLKGSMVSNRTLAAICIETGLYEHVMLAPALYSSVRLYAQALEKARSDEFGSVAEGRPTGQYWQEIDAPKVLSDAVESMLGAVYLSDDIEAAESAFNALLRPFFTRNLSTSAIAHHPSKLLQERIQGNKCHNFELVKKKTSLSAQCEVVVHDVVLATGEGVSTALATRQACWRALDALDGDPGFLKICDCTKAGKEEELG
uniref:RNase III domain-containing protein n=1 Tax=Mycena chlorophos TaxID=658473 RepID=A0ABQ0LSH5_MYCCL|nr:predicted protein [Mycena chlorophos]